MTINYTWHISSADGITNTETGLVNVVKILNWACEGKVSGTPATFVYSQWTILDDPDPTKFVDYTTMTEQDLINWVWAKEDKAAVEAIVADALAGAEELAQVALSVECLPRFWRNEEPFPVPVEGVPQTPAEPDPNAPELPSVLEPDVPPTAEPTNP